MTGLKTVIGNSEGLGRDLRKQIACCVQRKNMLKHAVAL
jgi:hypothetical protein